MATAHAILIALSSKRLALLESEPDTLEDVVEARHEEPIPGLLDFEKIEASQLPAFYRRIEAWPADMKQTADLGQLGLVQRDPLRVGGRLARIDGNEPAHNWPWPFLHRA